jgi:hypothetical protein
LSGGSNRSESLDQYTIRPHGTVAKAENVILLIECMYLRPRRQVRSARFIIDRSPDRVGLPLLRMGDLTVSPESVRDLYRARILAATMEERATLAAGGYEILDRNPMMGDEHWLN